MFGGYSYCQELIDSIEYLELEDAGSAWQRFRLPNVFTRRRSTVVCGMEQTGEIIIMGGVGTIDGEIGALYDIIALNTQDNTATVIDDDSELVASGMAACIHSHVMIALVDDGDDEFSIIRYSNLTKKLSVLHRF